MALVIMWISANIRSYNTYGSGWSPAGQPGLPRIQDLLVDLLLSLGFRERASALPGNYVCAACNIFDDFFMLHYATVFF